MTNNKYTNNKKDKRIASVSNQTVRNELFDLRLFIEKLAIDTEVIKKENAAGFAELRESQRKIDKENAAGFAELRESQRKIDKENAAGFAELRESHKKIDEENATGFAELRESHKKLNTLLGNLANNQGSIAEEFFYNTLKHNPVLGDIKFDRLMPNLTVGCKGKQSEYDIVLVNGVSVGIVEVKYKAHINDLEQVHTKIERFKRDCPEFKDYIIYGGIAALSVPSGVIKAAIAQGLFVLQQKGENLLVQTEGMKAF